MATKKYLKNWEKPPLILNIQLTSSLNPTLKPNEGKKYDSAHPAIYPTGNLPEKALEIAERNIFDLVIKRFLAVFGEPAIQQTIKVKININGYLLPSKYCSNVK